MSSKAIRCSTRSLSLANSVAASSACSRGEPPLPIEPATAVAWKTPSRRVATVSGAAPTRAEPGDGSNRKTWLPRFTAQSRATTSTGSITESRSTSNVRANTAFDNVLLRIASSAAVTASSQLSRSVGVARPLAGVSGVEKSASVASSARKASARWRSRPKTSTSPSSSTIVRALSQASPDPSPSSSKAGT